MEQAILRCGSTNEKYFVHREGRKKLVIQDFEAGVVEFIREYLTPIQKIGLVGLKLIDIEDYFSKKKNSLQDYCIELLSKKWYSRETDEKLQITKTEFEKLDYRCFSELKRTCKKGKLSIQEMELIIDHFTNDYSEWYLKD